MKTLFPLFLVLLLSTGIHAQKKESYAKVEAIKMDLVLDSGTFSALPAAKNSKAAPTKLARLYRFKNARIKKELAFKTKNLHYTV